MQFLFYHRVSINKIGFALIILQCTINIENMFTFNFISSVQYVFLSLNILSKNMSLENVTCFNFCNAHSKYRYKFNFIQVNNAISTDNAQKQWVSLGNLSVACLTIPETCGSAGGALSAWIKIGNTDYPSGGIISSSDYSEGFLVYIYNNELR